MKNKIVIIPSWGAGFYADFLHALQGFEFAQRMGARVSVCWGVNSLYYNDKEVFSQIFSTNDSMVHHDIACETLGYNLIKKPPLATKEEKIIDESQWVKKLIDDLNFSNYCIFNRYIFKFSTIMKIAAQESYPKLSFRRLHSPVDLIKRDAEDFLSNIHGQYIAIHVRASEKVRTNENSLKLANLYLEKIRDKKYSSIKNLVLLTEDPTIETAFREAEDLEFNLHIPYSKRNKVQGENLLGREGIRQAPGFLNTNRPGIDRISDAYHVVRDVLIGEKSDFFVGSNSNVSKSINYLRDSDGTSDLIEPNFLKVLG